MAAQIAVQDANARDGSVIPELATTIADVEMEVTTAFDVFNKYEAVTHLVSQLTSATPPAALVGGYLSSRYVPMAQTLNAYGVGTVNLNSAPLFDRNPNYPGLFRLFPQDGRAVSAVHALLREHDIRHVAVLHTEDDTWGVAMDAKIKEACAVSYSNVGGDHSCWVYSYAVPFESPAKDQLALLQSIKSSGVCTILNMLVIDTEAYQLLKHATTLQMAGTSSVAASFIWIMIWLMWDEHMGHPTDIYHGVLVVDRWDAGGVRPQGAQKFKDRWAKVAPTLKLNVVAGPQLDVLTAESTADVTGCLTMAAGAYDGVARVRLALEHADLSKSATPSSSLLAGDWIGREVTSKMQVPGTNMTSLMAAPSLRQALAPGLPWAESTDEYAILNFAGLDQPARKIYRVADGVLVAQPDLAAVELPGNTGGFTHIHGGVQRGKLVKNACNGENLGSCASGFRFGSCQLHLRIGGEAGWCQCKEGFVGKFCDIQGHPEQEPPSAKRTEDNLHILVQLGIQIARFDGIDEETFHLNLKVSQTWSDDRFPYDTGTYAGSTATMLLGEVGEARWWRPSVDIVKFQSRSIVSTELVVDRSQEPDVKLTLIQVFDVQEQMERKFQEYPFDKHHLHVQFRPLQTVVQYEVESYALDDIVSKEAAKLWSEQWPPCKNCWEEEGWTVLRVLPGDGRILDLRVSVERATLLAFFRLIIPSVFLVVLSWAALWIAPSKLMPRFASGFITFLSLTGFKSIALDGLPNDGNIEGVAWIDIYISCVGIMMGLSVVTTVVSQYVLESFSRWVSISMDRMARWSFPLTFITIIIVMACDIETNTLNVVVHSILLLFIVIFFGHTVHQVKNFAVKFLEASINPALSPAGRYRKYVLTPLEFSHIFNYLVHLSGTGRPVVRLDVFCQLLTKIRPIFKDKALLKTMQAAYGQVDEIEYPAFELHLASLITDLTLLLHDVDDHFHGKQYDLEKPGMKAADSVKYHIEDDEDDDEEEEEDHRPPVYSFSDDQDGPHIPPAMNPSVPPVGICMPPAPPAGNKTEMKKETRKVIEVAC